jgi:hypothetical protein
MEGGKDSALAHQDRGPLALAFGKIDGQRADHAGMGREPIVEMNDPTGEQQDKAARQRAKTCKNRNPTHEGEHVRLLQQAEC